MSIATELLRESLTDCYREAAKRKIDSKTQGDFIHFVFKDGSTLRIDYNGREAIADDERREYD